MAPQWDNFLRNLGEWHGSFASLNAEAEIVDCSPSILILEQGAEDRLVHFRLRRYGEGGSGAVPTREVQQEYRSLGRQVVFFDSGSFCKGSLQVAPGTSFGAEFGFLMGDRRHRLVQLFSPEGHFSSQVLIREFRAGSDAPERPALSVDALVGEWQGDAATITADWPEPEQRSCTITIEAGAGNTLRISTISSDERTLINARGPGRVLELEGDSPGCLQLLPDGGYSLVPRQVSHRRSFTVEAAWLPAPDRLERLIRRYDASGAWQSATHISARRN
jgi:hypothetical protein